MGGGKGWSDLTGVAASPKVSVVSLCDIDDTEKHMGRAAEKFPAAARFADWRRVLDKPKEFDAVTVSTPDHTHAPIALAALALGKYVFCQKPLAHTVFEARQMRLAAKKAGAVTQMGNQIQSHEFYRTAVRLVRGGAVGEVKEVHSWQSGTMKWLTADDRPPGEDPVPKTLHGWDNWLGAAPVRPFKEKIYHPWNWRAWQDFSNGQLGDFGCHILDPVFTALDLTAPLTVRGESSPLNREARYKWSVVNYEFPGTQHTAGKTLKLTWYDGEGKLPAREKLGVAEGVKLPGSGSLLIDEKGSLLVPRRDAPAAAGRDVQGLQDREGGGGGPLRVVGGRVPRCGQDDLALRLRGPANRSRVARHDRDSRPGRNPQVGRRGAPGDQLESRRRAPAKELPQGVGAGVGVVSHQAAAISDASTFRVPVNVRRPCIATKLSTSATPPRCHGTSQESSSPSSAATNTASRSSGVPSPNVIALEGSFHPRAAAISWLKNVIRPSGSFRTAGRTDVVTRRPSVSHSHA